MTAISRRRFLTTATALAIPSVVPSQVLGKPRRLGANDRIRLGFIGVGRRGQQLLEAMPEGGKVVAVCDVCRPRAEAVGGKYGAKAVHDFRRVLDRKDVDTVVIATPDHWHALPAVLACQAGKDVYCEKPLALTAHEGRVMVEAARKYKRVFQVGTQQRSLKPNRIACRLVRNGAMGKVKRVVVHDYVGPSAHGCLARTSPRAWTGIVGSDRHPPTCPSTGSTSSPRTSRAGRRIMPSVAERCAAGGRTGST